MMLRLIEDFLFHPIRTTKRYIRRIIALYILSLLPANYLSMATFTNLDFKQVGPIVQQVKDSGALNILTGGILDPLKRGFDEKIVELKKTPCEKYSHLINCVNTNSHPPASDDSPAAPENTHQNAKQVADFVDNIGFANDDPNLQPGQAIYGNLDQLGRSTFAKARITHKMVQDSAGWRAKFEPGSDPSGWGHNSKVSVQMPNGKKYRGYFWNRSHMIADSLGGRSYRNNLITGTRAQNVGSNNSKGGMAYIERRVVSFIKSHPSCPVYYSVVNNYNDNELVPRSSTVDVLSCDGSINEKDLVLNVMPGYTINYNDGTFRKVG